MAPVSTVAVNAAGGGDSVRNAEHQARVLNESVIESAYLRLVASIEEERERIKACWTELDEARADTEK